MADFITGYYVAFFIVSSLVGGCIIFSLNVSRAVACLALSKRQEQGYYLKLLSQPVILWGITLALYFLRVGISS